MFLFSNVHHNIKKIIIYETLGNNDEILTIIIVFNNTLNADMLLLYYNDY